MPHMVKSQEEQSKYVILSSRKAKQGTREPVVHLLDRSYQNPQVLGC